MKPLVVIIAGVLVTGSVAAKPATEPGMHDFAEGIELRTAGAQPLQQLALPDLVYATMTQWNAADVRVFNGNGQPVPYAFCAAADNASPVQVTSVPAYGLSAQPAATGNNITLRTSDGTQLNVQAGNANSPGFRSNASYVLDASNVDHDIDAIKLDWSAPSGDSEINVQVLASSDLSHWRTVVGNAALLRATAANHDTLEQSRIVLPIAHYQYLRIEPSGSTLIINSAQAEYHLPAASPQPIWYSAGAPHGTDDVHELRYDNSHRAPVSYVRITPHLENSSLQVTIQSRDREDHAWQTQWSGEVFDVSYGDQNRHNDLIHIAGTRARDWRLLFAENSDPPPSAPGFEFGYIPMQLRFLTQGPGPYMLAFGNARLATSAAQQCDSLLSSINADEKKKMVGSATVGATQLFAGNSALAVHHEIPTRTLVLWAILLIGVVVIARMALSMLKSNKHREEE